jgi:proline iminopeptidase
VRSGHTTSTAVPLYWASYGPDAAPGLLVLHGGPGAHHDYLLPQMLALADEYELVFYDQRGGGRSRTDQRDPITWRTQVDDLARVIAELGLEPPTLVGYSWGGLLALLYAIRSFDEDASALPRPERMVLIDPAPVSRAYRRQFETEFAQRQSSSEVQRLRQELAASGLRERDPDAYRQRLFELSVAGYFADPARARDLTPFRVMGRVQQSVWDSLGEFDFTARLRAVTCPVLVLHGTDDPIPLASSRSIARELPDAELVVLDGSGHVPYVEAPDELFAAIRRFLETTSGTARA